MMHWFAQLCLDAALDVGYARAVICFGMLAIICVSIIAGMAIGDQLAKDVELLTSK